MCKEQTHLGSGDAHTGGVGIQKLFLALKRAALIFDSKTFSDLRWGEWRHSGHEVSGARQAGEEQGKERRSLLCSPSPRWSKRTWWSVKLASKIISSIARSVVTFSWHALTIEAWFLPISLAKFRVIFLLLALFVFFVHCQNNFSIDSLCERDWIEPMTSRKREGGWPLRQWCLWPRLQFCSPFSFRRRWSLSLKTGTSSWSPRTGPPASGTTLTVTFTALASIFRLLSCLNLSWPTAHFWEGSYFCTNSASYLYLILFPTCLHRQNTRILWILPVLEMEAVIVY